MLLNIETIIFQEVEPIEFCEGKLYCFGCTTEILESENVFNVKLKLKLNNHFTTHADDKCLTKGIKFIKENQK